MMQDYTKADGFLFIGDPHISSRKPGRRVENEFTIIDVTVDKLDQAIDIANANNWVPLILGDLFDKSKDSKARLMTLLFKTLRKARHPVFCLPGNHDMLATDVTDDTALAAVEAAGVIHLLHTSNAIGATFRFGQARVALGSTLHGDPILTNATGLSGTEGVDTVVWLTHHDIAFEGAYPGSLAPHPIEGVQLLVNGHMHRTQPSILQGDTWWVNPGNIFRQTIADAKHVPAVWSWTPGMDVPERHPLRYIEHVFDWTGKAIASQMGDVVPTNADDTEQESLFVEQLQASLSSELPKTSAGDVLVEDMNVVTETLKPSDDVLKIIQALHKKITTPG